MLQSVALCSLTSAVSLAGASLRFGPQLEYVHYSEPRVMDEKGPLAGVFGDCTVPLPGQALFRVSASFVAGKLEYKSHPSLGLDLKTKTPNTIFDLRGEAGYGLTIGSCKLTPSIGIAYRLLVDDLPDVAAYQGYKREQAYYYVPLGLDLELGAIGVWSCSARAEYDLFLAGKNISGGQDINQKSGWGAQASVSLMRPIDFLGIDELTLVPFVQYWSIDRSEIGEGFFLEPKNNSSMVGLRIAVSL